LIGTNCVRRAITSATHTPPSSRPGCGIPTFSGDVLTSAITWLLDSTKSWPLRVTRQPRVPAMTWLQLPIDTPHGAGRRRAVNIWARISPVASTSVATPPTACGTSASLLTAPASSFSLTSTLTTSCPVRTPLTSFSPMPTPTTLAAVYGSSAASAASLRAAADGRSRRSSSSRAPTSAWTWSWLSARSPSASDVASSSDGASAVTSNSSNCPPRVGSNSS
jgi:hypothetical protein